MQVREVDHGGQAVDAVADVQDLFQGAEDVLLAGDLYAEPGGQAVALPPVDKRRDVLVDGLVDLLLGTLPVVEAEAGDDDVSVEGVHDEPGVADAVHALRGQFGVGAQVHVVRGVDGHVDIQPLRHLADHVQVAEAVGDAGGHVHEVVLLLDGFVRVAYRVPLPEDLYDEILLDVLQGHADLLVLGASRVGPGAYELYLQGAETEVVDILDSVLEGASFA